MFTGLIQRIGKVARVARRGEGARLAFEFEPLPGSAGLLTGTMKVPGGAGLLTGTMKTPVRRPALPAIQGDPCIAPGESVAVNGVCLTVAAQGCGAFEADVLAETLECTTLGALRPGARVNLERALRPADRMGGHFVSGHVDAIGTVGDVHSRGRDVVLRVRCGAETMRGIAHKGSIAVDGVSLTVSAVGEDYFEVNLIPTTLSETTLGDLRTDDGVNLETDLLGKYALRAMARGGASGITLETLIGAGFGE